MAHKHCIVKYEKVYPTGDILIHCSPPPLRRRTDTGSEDGSDHGRATPDDQEAAAENLDPEAETPGHREDEDEDEDDGPGEDEENEFPDTPGDDALAPSP